MKEQDVNTKEKKLHLSAADSLASRFPRQDTRGDLPIYGISGRKCSELFPKYALLGCLVKMLLGLSIWGSTKRFLTWSVRDTLFRHSYIRLSASARGMNAQDVLSWALMFPTPLASDDRNVAEAKNMNVYLSDKGIFRKTNPNGKKWSLPLSAVVFYLTPIASDGHRSTLSPAAFKDIKKLANLATQIIKQEHPTGDKAALNPDWVEWLMGFPHGWTDISCGNENLSEFPV